MTTLRPVGRGALALAVMGTVTGICADTPRQSQGIPYWSTFRQVAGPRAIDRAAQCRQESGFNPSAVSWVGARGIAQFMPATWSQWGQSSDPFDPVAGIQAQHAYMLWLEERTWDPAAALASYNCGLGNVRKAQRAAALLGVDDSRAWLRVGLPRVTGKHAAETQCYVRRIETIHVPWVKARVTL